MLFMVWASLRVDISLRFSFSKTIAEYGGRLDDIVGVVWRGQNSMSK